jgi:hypothetical protein
VKPITATILEKKHNAEKADNVKTPLLALGRTPVSDIRVQQKHKAVCLEPFKRGFDNHRHLYHVTCHVHHVTSHVKRMPVIMMDVFAIINHLGLLLKRLKPDLIDYGRTSHSDTIWEPNIPKGRTILKNKDDNRPPPVTPPAPVDKILHLPPPLVYIFWVFYYVSQYWTAKLVV